MSLQHTTKVIGFYSGTVRSESLIVSQHLSRQCSSDRPTSEASLPVRAAVMAVGLARPHLPWVVPTDMFEKYEESSIKQPGSPYPPVRPTRRHHCVAVVTCRHAIATPSLLHRRRHLHRCCPLHHRLLSSSLLSLVDLVIVEQLSCTRADDDP